MAFGYLMDMVLMLFDGIAERIAEKTAERKAIEKQAAEEATEQILKEQAELDAYIAAKEAEEQALREEAELAGKEFVENASDKTAKEVIEETAIEAEEKVVENVVERGKSVWTPTENKNGLWNKGKLGEHFNKHGAEVGALTKEQYSEMAYNFGVKQSDSIIQTTKGAYIYIDLTQ